MMGLLPSPLFFVNTGHILLPEGHGRIGSGDSADEWFIVVVPDPQGGGIIPRHACEENALIIHHRAGFAGDRDAVDLCAGACTVVDPILQYVHQQPCGRRLIYLVLVTVIVRAQDNIAVFIFHLGEGDGFAVVSFVRDAGIAARHFQSGKARLAHCQSNARYADVVHIDPEFFKITGRVGKTYVFHQGAGRDDIERTHQALAYRDWAWRALTGGGVSRFRIPSRDSHGHIGDRRTCRNAGVERRTVYRERLDGRADGVGRVIRAVQGFFTGRRIARADHGHDVAGAVVYDDRRRLRLDGFAAVTLDDKIIRFIFESRIIVPLGNRILHGVLYIFVYGRIDLVSVGADLVFNGSAVLGRVVHSVFSEGTWSPRCRPRIR